MTFLRLHARQQMVMCILAMIRERQINVKA